MNSNIIFLAFPALRLTEKTREAIIHLQERGVRVVIASGRAPNGVFPIAQTLHLPRFKSYILAFKCASFLPRQVNGFRNTRTEPPG